MALKIRHIALPFAVLALAVAAIPSGCDRRGTVSTGIPPYEIEAEAYQDRIGVHDSTRIKAIVHRYNQAAQVEGIKVNFYTLDFGYVTESAYSSATDTTGLRTPVYFHPQVQIGTARVLAQAVYGEDEKVADSDTVRIVVQ